MEQNWNETNYDSDNQTNNKNLTSNFLNDYNQSLETLKQYRKINLFTTILFTIMGLIGHFLTIFVFAQKRFRKNSSNVYLLCLALTDALYLIIHFFEDTIRTLIHLNEDNNFIQLFNLIDKNNTTCRSINYFRYVLRFISAYIIVIFSIQRLFLVWAPFSKKFKSTKSAWNTVIIIVCISLLVNLWVPFIYENKLDENFLYCDAKKEWSREYFHITLIYICLIMLTPIFVIFISNSIIIKNVVLEPESQFSKADNILKIENKFKLSHTAQDSSSRNCIL